LYSKEEFNMKKFAIAAALLSLAAFAGPAAGPADAAGGIKIGMLTCDIDEGFGFILGSSKDVDCVYYPIGKRTAEHYQGNLGRFGVDVGYTAGAKLIWAVIAAGKTDPGALEGHYGGAGAEATAIIGPGANVLLGGFKHSIVLQPLSVQGQAGLNVAAGIASLRLDYVGH
jgi:hypothetical protein